MISSGAAPVMASPNSDGGKETGGAVIAEATVPQYPAAPAPARASVEMLDDHVSLHPPAASKPAPWPPALYRCKVSAEPSVPGSGSFGLKDLGHRAASAGAGREADLASRRVTSSARTSSRKSPWVIFCTLPRSSGRGSMEVRGPVVGKTASAVAGH